MKETFQEFSHADYTVGWVCALPQTELVAAGAMLDEEHPVLQAADPNDINSYLLGRVGDHNVVIACLPAEQTGKVSAATVAKDMVRSFPAIRFGLMVGIGGGAPFYGSLYQDRIDSSDSEDESESEDADEIQDIRLGDVVISQHSKSSEAVIQYDFGKSIQEEQFIRAGGQLNKPPGIVLNAISMLQGQHARKGHKICELMSKMLSENPRMEKKFKHPGSAKDVLFSSATSHLEGKKCESCRGPENVNVVKRNKRSDATPRIHYGTIGSADQVMKDALLRDRWAEQEKTKCFEMEAAGLMDTLPCLVIRGICDYADSHKNKIWQPYAAAVAAAYAKELLLVIPGQGVINLPPRLELWRTSDEEEKCLQALFTTDYEYQKNLNHEREPGTCNWCLSNESFLKWQSNDTSCLLWITADPGCGKSVLSKSLIDERLFGLEPSDTTICYFFFKDISPEARSSTSALAACLHQILKAPRGSKAMEYALPRYRERADKLSESFDTMWKIVKDIAKDPECGRIVLVLDALDECEMTEQKRLMREIKDLELRGNPDKLGHHLKIIVTSRPYWNIESELGNLIENVPTIRLRGESISDKLRSEIDHVVRARVSRLGSRVTSDTAREELLEGLLAAENRTYLWLHLIFERITEMPRIDRKLVKDLLQNLPETVEDVYSDVLSKVKDQIQARRLLQIIVAAVRPLSVDEIGVALFFGEDMESYDELELQTGDQLGITIRNTCGLFVHIVQGSVFLIHHSAKEFLLSPTNVSSTETGWKFSISISDSHLLLASTCILFLRLKEFAKKKANPKRDAQELTARYVFLDYSANNWAEHFRSMRVADRDEWFSLSFDLFFIEPESCMDWQIAFSKIKHGLQPNILHLASCMGLENAVCKMLTDCDIDVNGLTANGRTPLFWAVYEGHTEIVRLLLSAPDIDVNMGDTMTGVSPLFLAAGFDASHTEIVKLLLDTPDVDVNMTASAIGQSPFIQAALSDSTEIAKLILNAPNIDINVTDCSTGQLAIWWPIILRNVEIVRALLEAPNALTLLLDSPGIDVNLTDDAGCPPLSLAINLNYTEAIKLLLEAPGIDINAKDGSDFTYLGIAVMKGHTEIVKLLLEDANIDPNMAGVKGHAPLLAAVFMNHGEAAKLLVEAPGINVNIELENGCTLLDLAIHLSLEEMVELLLTVSDVRSGIGLPVEPGMCIEDFLTEIERLKILELQPW
ncbi:hypothetical protein N7454_001861 [Penicillium verhagenii]|nr:hypothetical protein N7454_001861 [Penicillium verhagenii]